MYDEWQQRDCDRHVWHRKLLRRVTDRAPNKRPTRGSSTRCSQCSWRTSPTVPLESQRLSMVTHRRRSSVDTLSLVQHTYVAAWTYTIFNIHFQKQKNKPFSWSGELRVHVVVQRSLTLTIGCQQECIDDGVVLLAGQLFECDKLVATVKHQSRAVVHRTTIVATKRRQQLIRQI